MEQAFHVALAALVFTAAVIDAWRARVPNWLTLPAAVLALCMRYSIGGMEELIRGVAGLLTGFALLIGFYARGGMGAGDVKLLAAVGAFAGPMKILWISAYTGVLGGVYALGIVVYSMVSRGGWARTGRRLRQEGEGLLLTGGSSRPLFESLRAYPRLRYAIVVALGVAIEHVVGTPG
jgi:prepilin peptidase CpaA